MTMYTSHTDISHLHLVRTNTGENLETHETHSSGPARLYPVAPTLGMRLSLADVEFAALIVRPNLDEWIRLNPKAAARIEGTVEDAIAEAYHSSDGSPHAHQFLQRALYRINRLMLFWFDDLCLYENDRSPFLHRVRSTIETAWQSWELGSLSIRARLAFDVPGRLRERTGVDVDPPPSPSGLYFRDKATLKAYRQLVAIASLDGLVEASQLSRTIGGVSDPVQGTLTKLLIEEYGGGRLERKHSTYFRTMLEALGMNASPEAYLDIVPWEVLAGINHSFLLSDRRRHFLRYVGGLLYTETSTPAGFRCYVDAAQRLSLPPASTTYWQLHIKEDARHGPWMLNDVALPLADRYPKDAWEIVLGYDQQKAMSARAGAAISRSAAMVE